MQNPDLWFYLLFTGTTERSFIMSLWHTIKKELDGSFDAVRKSLSEALDMAEDLTRKGRTKLEVQSAKSDIRSQMTELGGRVHQMVVEEGITDVSGDVEVQSILDRIKLLEQKIEEKEEDLRRESVLRAEKTAG
jgi:virulence-associated protein VapD